MSYAAGDGAWEMNISDVNGDGATDLIVADENEGRVNILLGNGNGTFKARTSYSTTVGAGSIRLGDFKW